MTIVKMQGLIKLTGSIKNYRCTRAEASFVFTDSDKNAMGVVAVAAAIIGLSGPAIATAANAVSTEEDADYVEFDLDGKAVKGWVWRSPFKDGDAIEVAAEWRGNYYEAAGIARPVDRIIALYPHCSRGRTKHVRNAVKWWLLGTTIFAALFAIVILMITGADRFFPVFMSNEGGKNFIWLGMYGFFGLMTFSLARKWMPFVCLAEKVFRTLEWPNASNIDLAKSSKAQRKREDLQEFGIFYFRY